MYIYLADENSKPWSSKEVQQTYRVDLTLGEIQNQNTVHS